VGWLRKLWAVLNTDIVDARDSRLYSQLAVLVIGILAFRFLPALLSLVAVLLVLWLIVAPIYCAIWLLWSSFSNRKSDAECSKSSKYLLDRHEMSYSARDSRRQRLDDAFAKLAAKEKEKTARRIDDAIRSMTIEEYRSFRALIVAYPICINCKWLLNSWLMPGLVPAKNESEYDVSVGKTKYKVVCKVVCIRTGYDRHVNWRDTCNRFFAWGRSGKSCVKER